MQRRPMVTRTSTPAERADALLAALERLAGDKLEADLVLAALLDVVEDDRRLRARVLDRARDLLDESSEYSIHDLLRP